MGKKKKGHGRAIYHVAAAYGFPPSPARTFLSRNDRESTRVCSGPASALLEMASATTTKLTMEHARYLSISFSLLFMIWECNQCTLSRCGEIIKTSHFLSPFLFIEKKAKPFQPLNIQMMRRISFTCLCFACGCFPLFSNYHL